MGTVLFLGFITLGIGAAHDYHSATHFALEEVTSYIPVCVFPSNHCRQSHQEWPVTLDQPIDVCKNCLPYHQ